MGRRGYEALMQQLQQGMSALGSRLAMLESRDTGNVPQVHPVQALDMLKMRVGQAVTASKALCAMLHATHGCLMTMIEG